MYACAILNVLIFIAYVVELTFDYDVVLDEAINFKAKRKYIIKMIAATLVTATALFILYRAFGLNGDNLMHYIQTGEIIN